MEKIVIFREVQIPFPLIGIPVSNYFNTYIATPSNLRCILKVRLNLKKHCGEQYSNEDDVIKHPNVFKYYILKRLNMVLDRINRECVEGDIDLKCNDRLPLVIILPVVECEIFKKILSIDNTNYTYLFNVFSELDMKILNIDPGYLRALRCSYLFKTLCISRGYEDIIHNVAPLLSIEKINEHQCNHENCLYINNPYDEYTLSLLFKLMSHIISQLVQGIDIKIEIKIRNLIKLAHIIECEIVKSSLGIRIDYPVYNNEYLYKIITDVSHIVLYKITLS